ncbi:uncharacterized protein PITG_14256 [Phytophthora infestans T30-4]|uniref:Uncharacterized protein n=1 Tax=Phytophthora infestans (strain T30-4) TaxID=403677 RepID=D0NNZ2_PHYIT|nr:uncharacterized protein PITG_14256 [Phytophthora infestans T30-4]EEY62313.1 hypothetical protein PITG_14256 [Phytophthora infestans T30-4]|eukprot:XP_002899344.1 hypothetical protein PITG_14256 [Phytophthora infestans T30-4]
MLLPRGQLRNSLMILCVVEVGRTPNSSELDESLYQQSNCIGSPGSRCQLLDFRLNYSAQSGQSLGVHAQQQTPST